MSLSFLAPIAFAGLALLSVPLLIHLMARRELPPVMFPTLRFLRESRLTAWRRRTIDDWPLLVMRMAAVACAATALAGPLLVTDARQREWASRVSRALVMAGSLPVQDETSRAFASTAIELSEPARDALEAAVLWLNRQPPSTREIVFAGDLRASLLSEADLSVLPADIGLRFLPSVEGTPIRDVVVPMLQHGDAGPVVGGLPVHLEDARTVVSGRGGASAPPSEPGDAPVLTVRAAADDQAVADRALRAVSTQQMVLDQARERRVMVVWPGAVLTDLAPAVAPPTLAWIRAAIERLGAPARQRGEMLVVELASRPTDERAALELRDIARAAFMDSRSTLEPRRIPAADLARWSRQPGPPNRDAPLHDEGDRRGVWGAVVALLAIEHVWRRRRASSSSPVAAEPEDAAVA
ncbi:MAG: BatA domain-containing protein [Vicinamibacterales bacterium]